MKENYDVTAEGWLMRIRMEHARELLSSTDMTMVMVADRIGYQCVFAFKDLDALWYASRHIVWSIKARYLMMV